MFNRLLLEFVTGPQALNHFSYTNILPFINQNLDEIGRERLKTKH